MKKLLSKFVFLLIALLTVIITTGYSQDEPYVLQYNTVAIDSVEQPSQNLFMFGEGDCAFKHLRSWDEDVKYYLFSDDIIRNGGALEYRVITSKGKRFEVIHTNDRLILRNDDSVLGQNIEVMFLNK